MPKREYISIEEWTGRDDTQRDEALAKYEVMARHGLVHQETRRASGVELDRRVKRYLERQLKKVN